MSSNVYCTSCGINIFVYEPKKMCCKLYALKVKLSKISFSTHTQSILKNNLKVIEKDTHSIDNHFMIDKNFIEDFVYAPCSPVYEPCSP